MTCFLINLLAGFSNQQCLIKCLNFQKFIFLSVLCRCEDIASQFVKAIVGGKLKVAFGGGLDKFRKEGVIWFGLESSVRYGLAH